MKKKIQIFIEDSESPPPPKASEGNFMFPLTGTIVLGYKKQEKQVTVQIEGKEYGNDLSYTYIEKYDLVKKIEEGIPLASYLQDYLKRDISAEFQLLKKITETKHHNAALHVLDKSFKKYNRYSNIIPYAHSEVKIETDSEDPHDSYINANYVNSSLGDDKLFICTQGPLQTTRQQLWKMVWQENVGLIVMLSQVIEEGRTKCDQYWPKNPGETLDQEEFKVTNESINTANVGLVITTIELFNKMTEESRKVCHLQCTCWPDHGTPERSEYSIMENIYKIMKAEADRISAEGEIGKIVVHCSAGIGRTGTVVGLFNILSAAETLMRMEDNPKKPVPRVSVFGTVRRLREQRYCMVQTVEQYQYIYDFIADWIKAGRA